MNQKVNIIIFVNDATFLKECLYSIQKQTYSGPVEVWILGDHDCDEKYGGLKVNNIDIYHSLTGNSIRRIVSDNNNEKVFIIKSSYILSSNCLEKLTETGCDIRGARILKVSGAKLSDKDQGDRVYGYLLPVDSLDHFSADMYEVRLKSHLEMIFDQCERGRIFEKVDDAYIYDVSKSETGESLLDVEELCLLYEDHKEVCDERFGTDITKLCNFNAVSGVGRMKAVNCLYGSKKKLSEKVDWIREYVSPIHASFVKKPNEEVYPELREFCTKVSSDKHKMILAGAMGTTVQEIDLIADSDYEDYKYCRKYLGDTAVAQKIIVAENKDVSERLASDISAVEKGLKKVEQSQESILEGLNKVSECNVVKEVVREESLSGVELADFVKNCYADRKLGFKTIMSCVRMWFKGKRKKDA